MILGDNMGELSNVKTIGKVGALLTLLGGFIPFIGRIGFFNRRQSGNFNPGIPGNRIGHNHGGGINPRGIITFFKGGHQILPADAAHQAVRQQAFESVADFNPVFSII